MKYFEIFGLEPTISIDTKKLKRKYYQLSKDSHPDYFTTSSEAVQDEKLEMSSILNDAYKTLKDRDARVRYLLQQKDMLEEGKQQVPQDFLMEMMEINEALMELEMDFEEAQFQKSMQEVEAFESSLEHNFKNIAQLWEEAEAGSVPDQLYQDLKDYYLKNRYLLRIKENLSKFASR